MNKSTLMYLNIKIGKLFIAAFLNILGLFLSVQTLIFIATLILFHELVILSQAQQYLQNEE